MLAQLAVLCCVSVAVQVRGIHGVALVDTGSSSRTLNQDNHGNYAFGYDIVDAKGASNSRSEVGDGYGTKKGSYTLHDIDGRTRRVEYVADKFGFRAIVKTNEPGTAASSPAAVLVDSPYAAPIAPVAQKHAAPLAVAASVGIASGAAGYGSGVRYENRLDNGAAGYDSGVRYENGRGNGAAAGYDSGVRYENGPGNGARGYGNRLGRSAGAGYESDLDNDFGSGKGYDDGLGYGLSGHY